MGKSRFFYAGARFREYLEPHGVALIYGPANYPFQLAMVPAVSALYAGNAVVLKASERTSAVARIIEELRDEAGLPADLFQVVCDHPEDAAAYIDADPDIVFFTGSSTNGRSVAVRAAGRLIPTMLELGGKDPALVFADCNFERTVEGIAYGAFANAGQVCVGIKRLYIENSIYDEFIGRLVSRAEQLRVGPGHDSDLGVMRNEAARRFLATRVNDAMERGAHLETANPGNTSGESPIILSNVAPDARLLTEESFGPFCAFRRLPARGRQSH